MSSTENATDAQDLPQASAQNLRLLENIEVKLTVEVGGTRVSIRELLKLNEGSVVELDRLAGEHLDILVNGTLLAKGEIVLIGESLGIRFTEIISPEQRLRSSSGQYRVTDLRVYPPRRPRCGGRFASSLS